MADYLYTLVLTALIASVSEILIPSGQNGRTAGALRTVAGLCLLFALTAPIAKGMALLKSVADGDGWEAIRPEAGVCETTDYEAVFDGNLTHIGEEAVEEKVREDLSFRFSVPEEQADVEAVMETDRCDRTLCLKEIRIALFDMSAWKNPHTIEQYMTGQWGCPCYVTVGGRRT